MSIGKNGEFKLWNRKEEQPRADSVLVRELADLTSLSHS